MMSSITRRSPVEVLTAETPGPRTETLPDTPEERSAAAQEIQIRNTQRDWQAARDLSGLCSNRKLRERWRQLPPEEQRAAAQAMQQQGVWDTVRTRLESRPRPTQRLVRPRSPSVTAATSNPTSIPTPAAEETPSTSSSRECGTLDRLSRH